MPVLLAASSLALLAASARSARCCAASQLGFFGFAHLGQIIFTERGDAGGAKTCLRSGLARVQSAPRRLTRAMTSEEAAPKVIELLEQIVGRLENIDKKLSAIQADADHVARNTSRLNQDEGWPQRSPEGP
jgi:hypothetical protein